MFTHASWRLTCLSVVAVTVLLAMPRLGAQQPPALAPRTPRTDATSDLTGHWVSVVTEEWRWRMVTPPKGDYTSIPLSDEGRRVAFTWDPGTDGSCKAYGAAGLMRMPTRLNISWQGDDALKVESDAGQQTRVLQFSPKGPPGARSLQGFSVAEWEPIGGPVPAGRPGPRGTPPPTSLKVVTTNMLEGWLRKEETACLTVTPRR